MRFRIRFALFGAITAVALTGFSANAGEGYVRDSVLYIPGGTRAVRAYSFADRDDFLFQFIFALGSGIIYFKTDGLPVNFSFHVLFIVNIVSGKPVNNSISAEKHTQAEHWSDFI